MHNNAEVLSRLSSIVYESDNREMRMRFHFRKSVVRGVARSFQRGVTEATHRCSPSCISGLSRFIAAWRPILTKDKSRWRKYFTKKPNFEEVDFSTMAFTAKILSWSFRYLNIVGCLLKRWPAMGGSRAPQDPPPPSYAPGCYLCKKNYKG